MQKVERWPKHCKYRCERRHKQENTEKNDTKRTAEQVFGQCSPPFVTFFAKKTPQIPTNTEISKKNLGEESAKTRASAHASQEIDRPRAAADARAANNNNNTTSNNNNNNYNNNNNNYNNNYCN